MSKTNSIASSFTRQLILFVLFIILLLIGLRLFMKSYTNHGQAITVPDLREQSLQDAKKALKKQRLKFVVEDSTFNPDLPAGFIIDQNPRPNTKVKQKRTVYLVKNSSSAPPVIMPNLIDNSLRQATLKLENLGLRVGEVTTRPDIAKAVLEQRYKGEKIAPGDKVLKGEKVDLVLGDGFGNTTMQIPDLVGLSYNEARITLLDYGLSIGNVQKTETVSNIETAIIYEQSPSSTSGKTLEQGQTIDIYLTDI